MSTYFVGFTSRLHPAAESYFPPLSPPKNYKTSEAISGWLERANEDRQSEAAMHPIVGSVCEVVVLDEAGQQRLLAGGPHLPAGVAAQSFAEFVAEAARMAVSPLRLIGFRIADLVRMAALESAARGCILPFDMIGNERVLFDPYRRCIHEPARSSVDLRGFLRHLGLEPTDAAMTTAAGTAHSARLAAMRMGM